jgi:hypothetical protein
MRPLWFLASLCALGAASSAALAAPPQFVSSFFSYSTSFGANAVAIADVNLDSHPDVLVVGTAASRYGSGWATECSVRLRAFLLAVPSSSRSATSTGTGTPTW